MSTRSAVLVLVGFVVCVGAVWWFVGRNATPAHAPVQSRLSYVLTKDGDRYHEEVTDLYSIQATYPNLVDAKAQAAVESVLEDEIENFKKNIVSRIDEAEAIRIKEQGRPYELGISYKAYPSTHFSSFEFDVYLNTGGAHPNAFYHTLVLDAQDEVVSLDTLFLPGTAYLERLSRGTYPRVLVQLAERTGSQATPDMIDTVLLGTAPSPETLQFFCITDEALHLLFPPYQVAAYAAGSFNIAIPLSEIADILQPDVTR